MNPKGELVYTDPFLFWAKELQHLTDDQFSTAFKNLYAEIDSKKRNGEEAWPPSFVEFITLATPLLAKDSASHKAFEPSALLTDEKQIKKNEKAGRKNIDAMKGMFK